MKADSDSAVRIFGGSSFPYPDVRTEKSLDAYPEKWWVQSSSAGHHPYSLSYSIVCMSEQQWKTATAADMCNRLVEMLKLLKPSIHNNYSRNQFVHAGVGGTCVYMDMMVDYK